MQSSKSMKFLIENGFDFNTQALKGIPYFPGENKVKKKIKKIKKKIN